MHPLSSFRYSDSWDRQYGRGGLDRSPEHWANSLIWSRSMHGREVLLLGRSLSGGESSVSSSSRRSGEGASGVDGKVTIGLGSPIATAACCSTARVARHRVRSILFGDSGSAADENRVELRDPGGSRLISLDAAAGFIPEVFRDCWQTLLVAGVKGNAVLLTMRRSPCKLLHNRIAAGGGRSAGTEEPGRGAGRRRSGAPALRRFARRTCEDSACQAALGGNPLQVRLSASTDGR